MALFILIREIMIQSMTRRDGDIVGHQTDEGRVDTVQTKICLKHTIHFLALKIGVLHVTF